MKNSLNSRPSLSRRSLLGKATRATGGLPLAFAGSAASLAAAGCGIGSGGDVAPPSTLGQAGPPIEVLFMRPANPAGVTGYTAQADAFNRKQTRVKARFETPALAQGEAWPAKLLAMLAADAAPDCFT